MAAWKGALDYRGFPVNVAFFSEKKSSRGAGFKNVGPDGQAPVNKSFELTSGKELGAPDIGKAVLIGKGKAAVLHKVSAEAVLQISAQEKTQVMEAAYFAPAETIPYQLALMSYSVIPDPDVAGSERSATLIWNGLKATKLAYVTQATISSRDAVVVIYATETELKAVTLPFLAEMYPQSGYDWEVNKQMGNVFAESLDENYEIKSFDHAEFSSQYEARRNEIIEQVIAGNEVVTVTPQARGKEQPDLMAMLEASLAKPKAKKAPAKKKVTTNS